MGTFSILLNDKHVIKLILESCQLLSTAHHLLGDSSKITYKATHANHPCAMVRSTNVILF